MSKLYNIYLEEKKKNRDILLLFKSGIFYIAIAEDAIKLSNLLHLKLTNLNDTIQKCGFPCSSIEKYMPIFKALNIELKIIEVEKNTAYNVQQFKQNQFINLIIDELNNVDTNNLSVVESYSFIENLKSIIKKIE